MNKSKDHPNPGLYWNDQIILYDPAFQNEEYTTRVLAHELAHARFDHFLFEPETLKKANPGAYSWIKKYIGGWS